MGKGTLTEKRILELTEEKEAMYREMYMEDTANFKLVDGLEAYLDKLKTKGVRLNIATGSNMTNLGFYFKEFVLVGDAVDELLDPGRDVVAGSVEQGVDHLECDRHRGPLIDHLGIVGQLLDYDECAASACAESQHSIIYVGEFVDSAAVALRPSDHGLINALADLPVLIGDAQELGYALGPLGDDDDADDYSDDYGRVSDARDDYSDSAFGPDADDEENVADEKAYTSDDEYYEDEYTEEEQDMKDQRRKKKNRVWGIILAIEVVAAIVIGVLFVKAYINNTYNKMQYKELKDPKA